MSGPNYLFQIENMLLEKSEKIYSDFESFLKEYENVVLKNKKLTISSDSQKEELLNIKNNLEMLHSELFKKDEKINELNMLNDNLLLTISNLENIISNNNYSK